MSKVKAARANAQVIVNNVLVLGKSRAVTFKCVKRGCYVIRVQGERMSLNIEYNGATWRAQWGQTTSVCCAKRPDLAFKYAIAALEMQGD